MFCPPGLVFGGTVGVGSRFHVLRSRTRFLWYRGYQGPLSCCALHDSFSAVPRVSGPVFMFCVPELFFGGTEAVGSRFHVLCPQTRFWRSRGRSIPFSCLPLPGMFLAVPRVSGPFFMFCAPGIFFGGIEGVRSHLHVLRSRTRFRRYRGHQVPFSCFALPDSFSAVLRVSGPVFMFCVSVLVFDGTKVVGSRFHFLCSQTHFWRCRVCWVPFSCFACPDSFWMVPRASGPVFMFCAHELFFGGTEGVVSCFHVFCSRTHFRQCRVHWIPFSCFARPDSFLAVPRASGAVYMFCAPIIIFGGTGGVRSLFHVLPFRTRFGGTECVGSRFHVLRYRTRFRRYRGRPVPFICFALPDSFLAVLRVSGPVFMFYVPELIFGGTESVGSHFHVVCLQTHFWRCRGRRVPFS
jgi:hypothetical protein